MKKLLFAIIALIFFGCSSDSKDDHTTLTESDFVGKWKLTFKEGYGNDAGYIVYEFNKDGSGSATEFDNGGIDSQRVINKWYYDSDRGVIICAVVDKCDGHLYPMELLISEIQNKDNMKWIWVGEDNNQAYPVVRIAR